MDGSESSMKAADYGIAIARKKGQNNNAELIALHVIHSEIKNVYSTYYHRCQLLRHREIPL